MAWWTEYKENTACVLYTAGEGGLLNVKHLINLTSSANATIRCEAAEAKCAFKCKAAAPIELQSSLILQV